MITKKTDLARSYQSARQREGKAHLRLKPLVVCKGCKEMLGFYSNLITCRRFFHYTPAPLDSSTSNPNNFL